MGRFLLSLATCFLLINARKFAGAEMLMDREKPEENT